MHTKSILSILAVVVVIGGGIYFYINNNYLGSHATSTTCSAPRLQLSLGGFAAYDKDKGIIIDLANVSDQSVTYSLKNAPAWLTLQDNRNIVAQDFPVVGTYTITIGAVNACGATARADTQLTIMSGTRPTEGDYH
jgi:hypothetical protein